MNSMPKYVRPDDQTPELDRFISIFGNRARMAIIRHLQAHGPCMRVDLAAAVDIAIPTLGHHLAELENLGVIEGDLPPERRRGRTLHYSVNQEVLNELLKAPRKYIFD